MFKEGSNKLTLLVIVILAVLLALLIWKLPGQAAEINTISVSSTETIHAQPDKAELYLRVETVNPDAGVSQQRNSETSNKVISELLLAGVNASNIETSQYTLSQKIRYGQNGEQIVEGYVTVHQLKITTERINSVGELVDAGTRGGANGVDSITFSLSDDLKLNLRNQALTNAAADAKQKARKITDSLGVTLGKLHSVSESVDFRPYYAPYASLAVAADKVAAPTQIEPQTVDVSATLAVVYATN